MRNAIIGMVVGLVVGVVLGDALISPRLAGGLPERAVDAVVQLTGAGDGDAAAKGGDLKAERLLPAPKKAGPSIRWRMESAFASTLPQLGTQAKRIEEEIWRVSGGEMEIKFYEPGSLARDADIFSSVRAGTFDAGFISPDIWPSEAPALQLFGAIPFGPAADEYLAWIYFGGGEKLLQETAGRYGVHALVCGLIAPEGSGWFRRPVTTIEDLKGLRVRMTGLGARVMERMGAKTVPLDGGEIFHAMETGSIDAAEYSMPTIDLQLGLYRMARNYYFPGWHQPTTLLALIVHKDRWAELTPIQQSRIKAVCGDNVRHGLAEGEALQFDALLSMTKAGVAVRRWPREILDRLEATWNTIAEEQAARDVGFKKVWQSLTRFRRDYQIWHDLGSK